MKEYKVIAMSEEELISILNEYGIEVEEVEYDVGCVSIIVADENINDEAEPILAKHFNVDKLYMFCSDTDQEFPDEIMILLDFNPYES